MNIILYVYAHTHGFLPLWVPGRVGFLGFKSLIRLLVDDAFLGRPMLPRSQIDYAGMPMMCSTGKTMAIGGIMDGCSIAIIVRGYGRQIVVTIIKKNSKPPPRQNTSAGIRSYHTTDL